MKAKLIVTLDIPERDDEDGVTSEDVLDHVITLFEDVLYDTKKNDIEDWAIQQVIE